MDDEERRAKGRERSRQYRAAHLERVRARDRRRQTDRLGPERYKNVARSVLKWEVRSGRLKRLPCEVCGDPVTHAHHYLGYAPEHALDVQWLCVAHHAAAHVAMGSFNAVKGEAHPMARLTEEGVRLIRAQSAAGRSPTEIARDLGISRPVVSGVVHGRRWAHVV